MPESLAQILVRLLKYLRRFLLETAICFTGLTAIIYWLSPHFLAFLQSHFQQRLAFFGVLEPILALLKLSSVGALILMAPWILWRMSQGLVDVLGFSKKSSLVFMLSALLLFYAGALFCFFITLPFGINFLLGYQSQHLRPVIAVGKFVNFIGLFLVSFGLIFAVLLDRVRYEKIVKSISIETIRQILRANKVKLRRTKTWKECNDPKLRSKKN